MSKLRVNDVIPANGLNIGIGTAGGNFIVGGASTTVVVNGTFNSTGNSTFDGLVGIGTDTPSTSLDVMADNVPVVINSSNSNTYKIQLENAGSTVAYIGAASNEVYFANASAAEQARFTDNGLRFPSGKGIDFSATANTSESGATTSSELFDDYEEGSWTPDVSGGGVPWHNQNGSYVKIGKQVTAQFWLRASGTSSSSGGFSIQGLPFASGSYNDRNAGACRAYSLANFTGQSGVIYWMGGTSTSVNIVAVNGDGLTSAGSVDHNVWQNGAEIHCTIHYQTA